MNDEMELWTIKQTAEKIGLSLDAVYRAVRGGRLASVERYGVKLIRPEDALGYQKGSGGARPGAGRKKHEQNHA